MSSVQEPHLHLEVGHILFLDIVGYSKLLADEQKEIVQELNQIVRETEQFRAAEAEGKLTRLPTGDGMVLVFTNNPEAPVECALEISKALQSHPKLKIRMGIHSGPVNPFADVNDQSNLAGAGINVAQRVMCCGDAGHILLSKHFAEDLEHYAHWRPHLHGAGSIEAKHGARIPIVNFYTDHLGNSALPAKLKQARAAFRLKSAAIAALLLITAVGVGFWVLRRSQEKFVNAVAAIPAKSIAVLPFENLSHDPDNAYFADGIQDEILTRLAKIADLKVISRTSTQYYKSAPENLPEIATRLGVAHILEGRVQRSGDTVRVNVQLIKAADDSHLWADTFDRKLTDIFSVESEVAKAIAEHLQAKLTGQEEQVIAAKPTDNPEAYDAYLLGRFELNKFTEDGFTNSLAHFQQAIALDAKFALAYASLAEAYNTIGYWGYLAPKEAFPEAKQAAQKALAIDRDLAEAHGALAYTQFQYEWKFKEAEMEFKEAIRLNPNSASTRLRFAEYLSDFQRTREGHEQLERARELDPLSIQISLFLASESFFARDFDRALEQLQKTISMDPNNVLVHHFRAAIFYQKKMPAEAFTANEKGDSLEGIFSDAEMADMRSAYETSGLAAYCRKENEFRQKRITDGKYQSPLGIAMNYALAGADSEALDWLERAVDEHSPWLPELKMDPMWDAIRFQPRFVALLKKIGLEQQSGAK